MHGEGLALAGLKKSCLGESLEFLLCLEEPSLGSGNVYLDGFLAGDFTVVGHCDLDIKSVTRRCYRETAVAERGVAHSESELIKWSDFPCIEVAVSDEDVLIVADL